MKPSKNQLSLFEEDNTPPPQQESPRFRALPFTPLVEQPRSGWKEVPQARFESWSRDQQLAYCAARDEDSAAHADTAEWAAFYAARAQSYRDEIAREVTIES